MWHPRFQKEVVKLEKVQRRATKMVYGLTNKPYEKRLQLLNLPTLVYRRYRGDMIEVFKYLNGRVKITSAEFLPRAPPSARRGHDLKLQKRRCFTQCRSNFFSFRVVNSWNHLPNEVVSSPSLNVFKGRLDKYWGHTCYTMDADVFYQKNFQVKKRQQMISQKVTLA